ncbi:unnamed protein product [Enterobius vermicularis]|uniref:SANTA domain-containing protein n=1 Tax=Enterobius vermicularis TaxID=51028 RepID=A0A0N4VM32_ENTVE|nr:unnamed protein product [Enterobius vermicularis]
MSARKKSIEKVVELRMWIFRVSRNTVLLVGIAAFRNVDTFSNSPDFSAAVSVHIGQVLEYEPELEVRIEGYRSKDFKDDCFRTWRSSKIVERFNSRTIYSSRTKYLLCGIIDVESALLIGYPHLIIECFKEGFPPDWKSVLQNHYIEIKKSLIRNVPWFINIISRDLICDRSGEGSSAEQSYSSKEDENHYLVEAFHGNRCSDLGIPKLERRSYCSSTVERPRNKLPFCQFCNWTFKFAVRDRGISTLFEKFGLVLEGFRLDQTCDWKTSCVIAVEPPDHLFTASTEYKLIGPMNTALALQQGYPMKFIRLFQKGFPDNWHTVISAFFDCFIEPELYESIQPLGHIRSNANKSLNDLQPFLSITNTEAEMKPKRRNRKKNNWLSED